MKQTKRSYKNRLFYDFRSLESDLESMAQQGWKLKKLNNYYIEYERCEPQKLRYTVTYFSEASEFRPVHTRNLDVFIDYCRESGWQFVAAWTQMLIFCTSDPHVAPINTDPQLQLDAMDVAMKKGMLPSTFVGMASIVLLLITRLYSLVTMPVSFYASTGSILMLPLLLFCLLFQLSVPIRYFAWHHRAVRTVELGGEIPNPKWSAKADQGVSILMIAWLLVGVGFYLTETGSIGLTVYGILALFGIAIWWILGKVRRRGWLSNVKIRVAFVAVATIVGTVLLTTILFTLIGSGVFSRLESQLDEPLPLALEDIADIDASLYLYENDVRQSPLLKVSECYQRRRDYRDLHLNYTVYDTEYDFIKEQILADIMEENKHIPGLGTQYQVTWRPVDLPPATAAYQCYEGEEPRTYDYVLCYENRIVEVYFDNELTQEQVDKAIEILGE